MSRKATDTERAYPELERQRAKLAELGAKLDEVNGRLEAAILERHEWEARKDSILFRAEALLEGGELPPERDLGAEIRALHEQRQIWAKAVELQQARVDEAAREAGSKEYQKLKPRYIQELRKMISGVATIEAALAGMQTLRDEMAVAALPTAFHVISWPGLKPGDFQRQREAFEYKLKQAGLSEALK